MARFLLRLSLLLAVLIVTNDASAQGLQIEGQNRIRLFGSWTITIVYQADDFDLVVRTVGGERRIQFDEDDFDDDDFVPPETIHDSDPSGWVIDVYDEGESDASAGYFESTMVDENRYLVSLEIHHGPLTSPIDDAILLFEQHTGPTTPPTPTVIPPVLLPPSSTPSFTCLGDVCLYTWGEVGDGYTATPFVQNIGLASIGAFDLFGQRQQSSVLAVSEFLGPGASRSPLSACPHFQSPVDLTSTLAFSLLTQLNNPFSCGGSGVVTGSMYAASGFGRLKAYASLNTSLYPKDRSDQTPTRNDDGYTARAVAGAAEIFLVANDTRRPTSTNDRHVIFTFDVSGSTSTVARDAIALAGFSMRGGGEPCPFTSTFCQAGPYPWIPGSGGTTRSIPANFTSGEAIIGLFELMAAVSVGSNPTSHAATFDATALADFSATATLTRIQLFEGTAENPGPEIKGFTVTSKSGEDYNQYILDTTPPVTTLTVTGTLGDNGWYRSHPTIAFAADDADGSATTTSFSIESGPVFAYATPVTLENDGVHHLSFFSVDAAGNQEAPITTIIRVDSTAPSITAPADITVQQTSARGAVVSYAAPAVADSGSGIAAMNCVPASGSVLPVGTTVVNCTTTDVAGNSSSGGTFMVTVLAASTGGAVAALVDAVEALPESAFHKPVFRSWLLGDLSGVIRVIAEGNLGRAAFKLQYAIRHEMKEWLRDYVPSPPYELSKSQLLSLCDEAVAGLLSQDR